LTSELRSNAAYSFSGHETFPFRYTWLPKGISSLREHPDLFTREDALVILGVGKNMVRSIRHWCTATGVIERVNRKGLGTVTDLGLSLFGDRGWDPFLEDPGTLWLLHWRLVSRLNPASTWHLAFTRWNADRFGRDELVDWLLGFARGVSGAPPTRASLRRDVDVFIRTYVPAQAKRERPLEDTFDCPLVELGLLEEIERGLYRFARGPKTTLPDGIFASALIDYWLLRTPNEQSLSFETILHGLGSPGGAFKLSENALAERLERLPPKKIKGRSPLASPGEAAGSEMLNLSSAPASSISPESGVTLSSIASRSPISSNLI
jgi:Protein of unknown function (DUF4007)